MKQLLLCISLLIIFSATAFAQNNNWEDIRKALKADGTIEADMQGSFSGQGYQMRYDKNGAPLFFAADSGYWEPIGTGLNGTVLAIAEFNNDLYIGGEFTDAGGDTNADYIAKWSDSSWHALSHGLNGFVNALAVWNDNLYIGGYFTNAGGDTNGDFIAGWDGNEWFSVDNGLNNSVSTLNSTNIGLYVGGWFTNAGGDSNCKRIAIWNGSSWSPIGSGFNDGGIDAIAISDSVVYAGGYYNYISKWNGLNWSFLSDGNLRIYLIRCIAVSGSYVYLGGIFSLTGDSTSYFLVKWNNVNWEPIGSGEYFDWAGALVLNGNNIYAGGRFTDAGGNINADNIAKWNGDYWESLESGVHGNIRTMLISGSYIYIGGNFDSIGNQQSSNFARWYIGTTEIKNENINSHIFFLNQNFPNPFNPSTVISYQLAANSKVSLKIYNLLGQEVRALYNGFETAGAKQILWDGKDNHGKTVSGGVYIYRLQAGEFVQARKCLLLK